MKTTPRFRQPATYEKLKMQETTKTQIQVNKFPGESLLLKKQNIDAPQ